jgi:zinc finger CCHC domain-containing protein 8
MASSRYYEDKEAEIQPGKISAELRAALSLAENDIPIWIYRMRAIGYPPGWLRKAIVDTEDIFDTDSPPSGKRKGGPEREETRYDHTKLIEYPGFNMPLPPDTHDYHYYYNMPPMLPHQQLDYAKKIMKKPNPVSLKRVKVNNDAESSKDEDDDNGEDDEDDDDDDDNDNDDNDNGDNDEDGKGSSDDSKTPAANNTSSLSEEIKLVSKGSPMPKPVNRLPLEKFSEGVVGELLYFENIPSSTGKFDKIRNLLDTMRRSSDTSFAESTSSKG